MRLPVTLLLALLPTLSAAQATIQREAGLGPRQNQKIERIRIEDDANRIEEVRVGGQTQNVTVQPKADVPAYEIQPNDLARDRPSAGRDGLAERKQRVWNVFSF